MTHSTILMVDDDPVDLELLTYSLSLEQPAFEIETVLSPDTALHRLAKRDYGVLLTDLSLPELDGLAVLKKAIAIRPETPVILMSAHASMRQVSTALGSGAYDFLSKRDARGELSQVLRFALKTHRLSREVRCRQIWLGRMRKRLAASEEQAHASKARCIPSRIADQVLVSRQRTESSLTSIRQSLERLTRHAEAIESHLHEAQERLDIAMIEAQLRAFRRLQSSTSFH